MANTFAQDKMTTLFNMVAETTDINCTLSKDLNTYSMGDEDGQRSDDIEYIPQEFRFETKDGIESTDADFEDLTDRMIPIYRNRAKRILFTIKTKELRDSRLRDNAAKGVARDIRNAIDTVAYQEMINRGNLVQTVDAAFTWQDGVSAENLMYNRGLGGYAKKAFLSNTDYAGVAKELGAYQYADGITKDALMRAKVPDLATFDTMRSDYVLRLPANTTAGVTVNGAQSHTVATYANVEETVYLDNREMTLNVNTGTITNMPAGTKFTIAGVNALNPETREDTGDLQTFTVLGGTASALTVSPAIIIAGPYRNCSAEAADTAAIVMLNAKISAPSLFYTPESTLIVPGNLPVPSDAGGVNAVEAVTEQGLPMRMTYWYDPHKEQFNCKALVFFDVVVKHPDMVLVSLAGQA